MSKILFVCSKNKWRSPTAETLYRHRAVLQVRSAGTSASTKRRLSAKDLAWADIVIVMEDQHRRRIRQLFPQEFAHSEIIVLAVEDNYPYMHPELVAELQEVLHPLLEEFATNSPT